VISISKSRSSSVNAFSSIARRSVASTEGESGQTTPPPSSLLRDRLVELLPPGANAAPRARS
jgi:hypothetical protein